MRAWSKPSTNPSTTDCSHRDASNAEQWDPEASAITSSSLKDQGCSAAKYMHAIRQAARLVHTTGFRSTSCSAALAGRVVKAHANVRHGTAVEAVGKLSCSLFAETPVLLKTKLKARL